MIIWDEVSPLNWDKLLKFLRGYQPSPYVKERISTVAKGVRMIHRVKADGSRSMTTSVIDEVPSPPQHSALAIGRQLYHERVQAGFSLREAAGHLGMAASELSKFEHSGLGLTQDKIHRLRVLYG